MALHHGSDSLSPNSHQNLWKLISSGDFAVITLHFPIIEMLLIFIQGHNTTARVMEYGLEPLTVC
jgi:hypothetical protein